VLVVAVAVGLAASLQTVDHHRTFLVLDSLGLLTVAAQEAVGITVGQPLLVAVAVAALAEPWHTVRTVVRVLQTLAALVHHRET
jgi:hypothetical protein